MTHASGAWGEEIPPLPACQRKGFEYPPQFTPLRAVSENGLFAPFMYKNEYFTKTGSGQTQGKLKIKDRLSSGRVRRRCSLRQRPLILSVWSTFRTSPRRARPRWRSFCSPGMRCTCRLTGSITSSQRAPPSGEMMMRMVAPFSVFLAENGRPLFCFSQSVSCVGVGGLPIQARDSTQGKQPHPTA